MSPRKEQGCAPQKSECLEGPGNLLQASDKEEEYSYSAPQKRTKELDQGHRGANAGSKQRDLCDGASDS